MNKKFAGKQRHNRTQHRLKPAYAAVLLAFAVQTAQANPTGGTVTSGSASFATSGSTLTVTNTPGTIINWQGFSIGSNEITRFAQQSASSTVLNRVVGNDPSNILGKLQSNGRVFLVNPNGILFGAGAVVDVAGLVASTLNLSDADFLAGNYHFTAVPGAANVSNAGNITSQDNGQIFLIAPNVENTGVITAPNGEILLAAGASVDLVNSNDPNLRVNITAPAGDATNIGQLIASSGSLGLFGAVVRNSGEVSADSATLQGGKIVFKASQLAEIGGTVSATGVQGGDIQISGKQVALTNSANVDASGTNGGGTVLVGGDAHGANAAVQNAQLTFVSSDAAIKADALQSGNGGKVVVWADGATQFNGNISARGGAVSGNGGWVEVSGRQWLGYAGLVNTTATNGMVGSLLLDPMDITISNALDTLTMILGGTTFADATALATSNLNITTLTIQLALSNVTVDTTSAAGTGVGSITVQAPIAWASANSLTLNATGAGAINVNANITNASTGGLSLLTTGGNITIGGDISLAGGAFTVNTTAPTATISMTGALTAGTFTLGGGTWQQVSAPLPNFAVTDFRIAGGTFIRALGGNGNIATPYQLADIYGIQGIGSTGMLGNSYVLANDIEASATLLWLDGLGAPIGFAPVGNNSTVFTGQFDGQGHTISNLYINLPSQYYVGLFGYVSTTGSVSNVALANANVTGYGYVGGLAGTNAGTINNSSVSGSVTGGLSSSYVGGLVGINYGSISNSSASANVQGTYDVGGLVGHNAAVTTVNNSSVAHSTGGVISNSYVTNGTVSGGSDVGGLVGYSQNGSITGSYVTGGTVTGIVGNFSANNIGGLVGRNASKIDSSYVTGTILVHGAGSVGGLVGYNDGGEGGNISNSHFSAGTVTGTSDVGGLVGNNYGYTSSLGKVGGVISKSYVSNGAVTGSSNHVGGLAGYNTGTINTGSYVSGGSVKGASEVGGLVGYNYGGSIDQSHVSAGDVSGGSNIGGLVGQNGGTTAYSYSNISTITNSYVDTGTVVSGVNNIGGLVGVNGGGVSVDGSSPASSTISASYFSGGTVTGSSSDIGGLVGYNAGNISNSHVVNSNINVGTGSSGSNVGGLVGLNGSVISNSYVSGGTVTGLSNVGGLVGQNGAGSTSSGVPVNASTITGSYVSGGTVNGGSNVGGLVGNNAAASTSLGVCSSGGCISTSYVSGSTVTASSSNVGGLVGNNSGIISNSFASKGTVSGYSSVGGLVGSNNSGGSISNTYASGGTVSGNASGFDVGGLVGYNTGTINTSYASSGTLSGGSRIGGVVGYNDSYGGAVVSASFWNTSAAGAGVVNGIGYDTTVSAPTDTGATGLTSAGMMAMSNFTAAGWSISNTYNTGSIWTIYEGTTMPLLSSFIVPVVIPPVVDVIDKIPNVTDEIVEIVDQREKPKPEELLVFEEPLTGVSGNPLPMCN